MGILRDIGAPGLIIIVLGALLILYDPKEGGIGKKRWVEKLILYTYPFLRQKNSSLDMIKKEKQHGFLE